MQRKNGNNGQPALQDDMTSSTRTLPAIIATRASPRPLLAPAAVVLALLAEHHRAGVVLGDRFSRPAQELASHVFKRAAHVHAGQRRRFEGVRPDFCTEHRKLSGRYSQQEQHAYQLRSCAQRLVTLQTKK